MLVPTVRRLLWMVLLAALLDGCSRTASRALDDATLGNAAADAANWPTYGRTYSEQRHSPLTQITEQTVSRLGLAWSLDLNTRRGLEATPLVKDGLLYTTSAWSVVYAVNAKTGQLRWVYDPKVPKAHARFACCDAVNRGAALYREKVYAGTLDGRLIALDADSGRLAWEVQTTPTGTAYTITGAPRIVKGRVLIGNSGAEYGVRGYVSAYDAETGAQVWRTYTVPGDPSQPFESEAMRKAAETWKGEWWKAGGGGTAWDAIVYDPELDFVYVGTGNGSPWFRKLRSPGGGDNLYLSSIIALRADDGAMIWHYQTTPGDNWDYTATQPLMLADIPIAGVSRKVIMQAPKNGFFYVLDRATGELLSARKYTDVTWASRIDAAGRPVEDTAARELEEPTMVSPDPNGGHNWHPMAFNPSTGLVYFPVLSASYLYFIDAAWRYVPGDHNTGGTLEVPPRFMQRLLEAPYKGHLVAWDPVRQREAWRFPHATALNGGALSTAGNLIFEGGGDGKLRAFRATDGAVVWEHDVGTGIAAAPISYSVEGVQYVAVMAGWGGPMVIANVPPFRGGALGPGRLLAFTLDGSATLPPRDTAPPPPVPMPEFTVRASAAEVAQGARLYGRYCIRCHGFEVESGGSIVDLRYASRATHDQFERIVLGGVRQDAGMPSFAENLTSEEVRLVQAYVLVRAREAANARK